MRPAYPQLSSAPRFSDPSRQSAVPSCYGPSPGLVSVPSATSVYPSAPQPTASDSLADAAPSSEWDYAVDKGGGHQLQTQSSFSSMMSLAPPAPPMTTAESVTTTLTATHPLPPPGQAAPLPLEYEEVPPWNKPRSVDDLHFNYSMKCETTAWRIFRVLSLIVPAGLIVAGAMNLNGCPLVPWLPHWNIVVGSLWFVHCGFYFLFRKSNEKNTMGYRFIKGLFLYLVFAAFVTGTALTYGAAVTTRLVIRPSSCQPAVFFSAFGLISAGYLILAVFLWFYIFTFTFSFYEPELVPA